MADIRSFFASKNGGPAAKPAPKEPAKPATRQKSRKVVQDSDDDEEPPKPAPKAAAKKSTQAQASKGVATTASDYFSSSSANKPAIKSTTPKKADRVIEIKTDSPLRVSPRTRAAAAAAATTTVPTPSKPAPAKKPTRAKKPVTTYNDYDMNDDEDAYMEDADEDNDIFAADAKSLRKRKNDDYVDEDSDEEQVVPKAKRIVSRSKPPAADPPKPAKPATAGTKRKSPEPESEESEDEVPRKKPAAAKPKTTTRAPRAKKAAEPEDEDIKDILDNVPLVTPPTPPPRDPNVKFDWKKANAGGGGGGGAGPPNPGAAEIPEGEDECLSGLTFVFTGVLQTIGREEGQALVKKYGGKVTGQPSSKTSFVVVGDDAGPSKLNKIKQLGIKSINEEGLFDLIRKLPAYGGSGKGAQKAQEKKKADEIKVKQQAEEMDRQEKEQQREAAKIAKKAAEARGISAPATPAQPLVQLWTTKHAPVQMSHICGNKSQVEKIQSWLKNWQKNKRTKFSKRGGDGMGTSRAIIISGPPGIGKTTAAHLASKLEGYDVIESNASDTRSKKLVENGVAEIMNNTSLNGFFAGDGKKVDDTKKQIVLIMDEVDGMSAGDRGGVGALAKFCKTTEVPLILICNERRLPKMKPFDFVAFDIKFARPTVDQIRSRIMTICHREGLKLNPQVVDAIIEGSNKDIRQIINMVSTIKLDQSAMDFNKSKQMTKAWEKHVVLKPWDICQKMLGGGLFAPASKATLNDKIELYFNDHDFSFLMIQENYLRTKPLALSSMSFKNDRARNLKALELFDSAAESISDGDLVDRMIHGPQQHWSLMPTHAVFSTVRPASFIAGQLMGSSFTSWLGNNSKYGKLSRFVREIHSHMRLKSSGDHNEVRQQYLPVLWHQIVEKLSANGQGKEGVDSVIEMMDSYFLTRDDFDSIKELGVGPQDEEHVKIETQTKATFTRTYNAMNHPVPFLKATNVIAPKKMAKDVPDLEEAIEEEDDTEVVEPVEADDDELDLKNDKYIKQSKKKPVAKKGAKATKGKAKGK